METKAQIIQKLLDEKHITVEQAMVLIQSEQNQVNVVPVVIPEPRYPAWPYNPFWNQPYYTTSPEIIYNFPNYSIN